MLGMSGLKYTLLYLKIFRKKKFYRNFLSHDEISQISLTLTKIFNFACMIQKEKFNKIIKLSSILIYQVAGNDHLVFGELDVLSDTKTFQQLFRFLLSLKLLLSEMKNNYFWKIFKNKDKLVSKLYFSRLKLLFSEKTKI